MVQRLGFADPRPQQMEAIKTFMQGKDAFFSSVGNWIRQNEIANKFSAAIRVRRIAWL